MGFAGFKIVLPIFSAFFLLWSTALWRSIYNTTREGRLLRRGPLAVSALERRAIGHYVLLQTEFLLKLELSPSDFTWVPRRPSSVTEFCGVVENQFACGVAGISGYYLDATNGGSSSGNFSIQPYVDMEGYWMEDTITAGGITIDLQFGVATKWDFLPPFLGLGLNFPDDAPISNGDTKRPSFLKALLQQGKIPSQACGFYNILDTASTGEVIVGGVDRNKFYGDFDIYDWKFSDAYENPTISSPTIRIGNVDDPANIGKPGFEVVGRMTEINPFWSYMNLPEEIFNTLITALRPFNVAQNNVPDLEQQWGLPCDIYIPPQYVMELSFKQAIIRIPFNDLVSREDPLISSSGLCELLVGQIDYAADEFPVVLGGPFFSAAYVVLDPGNKITGIAVSVRNSTTRDLVEAKDRDTLSSIKGNAIDPPIKSLTASPGPPMNNSKRPLPVGAIAGIGVAGGLVLMAGIVFAVIFYRRVRKGRNMPPQEPYPHELDSKARPIGELEGSKEQPLRELPGDWRPELQSNQRHELEAH